jgi:MoaA/NifB/PqqE/SkfB family radical SAM enzyme
MAAAGCCGLFSAGGATSPLQIPAIPTLVGLPFDIRAFGISPGLSDALATTIGSRPRTTRSLLPADRRRAAMLWLRRAAGHTLPSVLVGSTSMLSSLSAPVRRVRRGFDRFASLVPGLKPGRAYLNWARANIEMLRGTSRVRARPLKLTFDPTNVCQLRCPLCPTGLQIHDRAPAHAEIEPFAKLMEEVGDYVFFIDFFNWGEPLLNKNLEELLRLAHDKRISTLVSSNLSLKLSDERITSFVESGVSELMVSLDGASQETYESYRRRGEFDLVVDNMRRIVETKRALGRSNPTVTWRYLVFRFNEHELDEASRLAEDIGVDRIVFAPAYLDEGRFPVSDELKQEMSDWAPKDEAWIRYEGAPTDESASAKPRKRCDWHYVSAAVNPDGSVAPCCTLYEKQDDFGHTGSGASEQGFMETYNNENFVAIRERFAGKRDEPTGLVCETCPTPDIMDYARQVNRDVALLFGVQLVNSMLRLVGLGRRTNGR